MAQISRPFQIALVALLALATLMVMWFMVLHRSSGTTSSGSASPSVAASAGSSATQAATHASGAGSGRVYHGSAPGVEGLTRDIKRAHEAAAKEERGGAYDEQHAGQTPAAAASAAAPAASARHAAATVHTHSGASVSVRSRTVTHTRTVTRPSTNHVSTSASKARTVTARRTPTAPHAAGASKSTQSMQSVVAAELKQGRVALLLFWNPRSSDDVAVDRQVQAVAHKLGRSVAVHTASASQVNSFGSITRQIQVYQTPTLLIVNPKGQVTTMAGYNDAFAIEQTIAEARG